MKSMTCLLAVLTALAVFSGCATTGKGMSDVELINLTLDQWAASLVEQDIEKFQATISESFSSPQAPDKKALGDFIEQAMDSGYIDEAEIIRDDAQLTITDNTCSVYPIDLMSIAGSVAVELKLTKENGQWLITGMEVDGI